MDQEVAVHWGMTMAAGDTENGYRRDESWETKTFRIAEWNDATAQALKTEFEPKTKSTLVAVHFVAPDFLSTIL